MSITNNNKLSENLRNYLKIPRDKLAEKLTVKPAGNDYTRSIDLIKSSDDIIINENVDINVEIPTMKSMSFDYNSTDYPEIISLKQDEKEEDSSNKEHKNYGPYSELQQDLGIMNDQDEQKSDFQSMNESLNDSYLGVPFKYTSLKKEPIGDLLKRYDMQLDDFLKLNPQLKNKEYVEINDELILRKSEIEKPSHVCGNLGGTFKHEVKKFEPIEDILSKCNLTFDEFLKLNPKYIYKEDIQEGDVIVLKENFITSTKSEDKFNPILLKIDEDAYDNFNRNNLFMENKTKIENHINELKRKELIKNYNMDVDENNRDLYIDQILKMIEAKDKKYRSKLPIEDRKYLASLIVKHSLKFKLDPILVACIISKEVNFRYKNNNIFGENGNGMMQVNLGTANDFIKNRAENTAAYKVAPNIIDNLFSQYKDKPKVKSKETGNSISKLTNDIRYDRDNYELNLIMGLSILKEKIRYVALKNPDLSYDEIVRLAVRNYNGNVKTMDEVFKYGGDIQVRDNYHQVVMNNYNKYRVDKLQTVKLASVDIELRNYHQDSDNSSIS